ncbi:uncharacterized protein SCHCODRAFT_02345780 [Schizophyllum commune H4-8]|uniref:uncharacterized protein n=1 Tax=Schizophyllum commune (strain H4-8 / FGSC 9210) TaxID=578458 RepID=UPI00215E33D9|nr:uncharacterized protein SCHCODRAFT_02345780 [Schizophyllum commune H4-8]KAI5890469.1 hypothetical protein SCHCODRAFT_02345780 [Schizophyllum commune H4-8]
MLSPLHSFRETLVARLCETMPSTWSLCYCMMTRRTCKTASPATDHNKPCLGAHFCWLSRQSNARMGPRAAQGSDSLACWINGRHILISVVLIYLSGVTDQRPLVQHHPEHDARHAALLKM